MSKWNNSFIILLALGLALGITGGFAAIKSTSGTIRADVDNDGDFEMHMVGGNLGLGTSTPSSNLHVIGNAIINNGNMGVGTTSPSSTLHVAGTIGLSNTSITSDTELGNTYMALADSSSGNVTVFLPAPSSVTGRIYQIKKINASNSIHVSGNGQLIDLVSSVSLGTSTTGNPFLTVISNGTKWLVLSNNDEATFNASYIWTNSGGNTYASDANNWLGNIAPGANVDVTVNGTSTDDIIWDITTPVENWTQSSDYTGNVIIETVYTGSFTVFTINGNLDISGGSWTHRDNTTTPTYYLNVTVGGEMTLGASANINADGLGYDATQGSGNTETVGAGGGHGGRGHNSGNSTYGSFLNPTTLGSGGSGGDASGGGAISMVVTGNATINGKFHASGNAAAAATHGGGAGGSIYYTAASITGSGNFMANGGAGNSSGGGGGGGRVALLLTGASSDLGSFTVGDRVIEAYGGIDGASSSGNAGGAGSVYEQHGSQNATNSGNIVISNNSYEISGNVSATAGPDNTSGVTTDALSLGNATMVLKSSGNLTVASNVAMGNVLLDGGDLILGDSDLIFH